MAVDDVDATLRSGEAAAGEIEHGRRRCGRNFNVADRSFFVFFHRNEGVEAGVLVGGVVPKMDGKARAGGGSVHIPAFGSIFRGDGGVEIAVFVSALIVGNEGETIVLRVVVVVPAGNVAVVRNRGGRVPGPLGLGVQLIA